MSTATLLNKLSHDVCRIHARRHKQLSRWLWWTSILWKYVQGDDCMGCFGARRAVWWLWNSKSIHPSLSSSHSQLYTLSFKSIDFMYEQYKNELFTRKHRETAHAVLRCHHQMDGERMNVNWWDWIEGQLGLHRMHKDSQRKEMKKLSKKKRFFLTEDFKKDLIHSFIYRVISTRL